MNSKQQISEQQHQQEKLQNESKKENDSESKQGGDDQQMVPFVVSGDQNAFSMNMMINQNNEELKSKSEKKYHRRKKTDINDKPYKCGCSKEFNDYSSLYTHIKTNHDLKIPENTVLPQLKKKDVMTFLKEQKGDPIQSKEYEVEIEDTALFYLDQEELLCTFLKFEDCFQKSEQESMISEYFHPEDQVSFLQFTKLNYQRYQQFQQQCFILKNVENLESQFPNLYKDQSAYIISNEYLKPFTAPVAMEITQLIEQVIIMWNQTKDINQIQEQITDYYEKTLENQKKNQEIASNEKQQSQKQGAYFNLQKLNIEELKVYLSEFTLYFLQAVQQLPEYLIKSSSRKQSSGVETQPKQSTVSSSQQLQEENQQQLQQKKRARTSSNNNILNLGSQQISQNITSQQLYYQIQQAQIQQQQQSGLGFQQTTQQNPYVDSINQLNEQINKLTQNQNNMQRTLGNE